MRTLVWVLFALAALFWTGGAVVAAGALDWFAGMAASGSTADWGAAIGSWSIPAWATYWIDVTVLHALLEGAVSLLQGLQQAWPWVGTMLGWLVPLTWVLWGLGLVLMLTIVVLIDLVVRRTVSPVPKLA